MAAAVAADRDPPGALLDGESSEGPAKRARVVLAQRVADDPADVIFAKDGGVETVTHCAALRSETRFVQPAAAIGSTAPGSGIPSPAIIWRSSCRAATWAIPTSPRSARSSRVRPFGKSSR